MRSGMMIQVSRSERLPRPISQNAIREAHQGWQSRALAVRVPTLSWDSSPASVPWPGLRGATRTVGHAGPRGSRGPGKGRSGPGRPRSSSWAIPGRQELSVGDGSPYSLLVLQLAGQRRTGQHHSTHARPDSGARTHPSGSSLGGRQLWSPRGVMCLWTRVRNMSSSLSTPNQDARRQVLAIFGVPKETHHRRASSPGSLAVQLADERREAGMFFPWTGFTGWWQGRTGPC